MGLAKVAIQLGTKAAKELLSAGRRAFPSARKAAQKTKPRAVGSTSVNSTTGAQVPQGAKSVARAEQASRAPAISAPNSAAQKIDADKIALEKAKKLVSDPSSKEKLLTEKEKIIEQLRPMNLGLKVNHLEDISSSRIFRLAAKDGGLLREIDIKFDPKVLSELIQGRDQAKQFGSMTEAKFISLFRDLSNGKATLNIMPNNTISLDFGGHVLSATRVGRTFIFDSIKWGLPQAL